MMKKIAITGPESTGKSALAMALARHYNRFFVPEFAREYIAGLNREYNYDDILEIAKQQIENEHKAFLKGGSGFLFCDTDLIVTRIWCLHRFGRSHGWIDENIIANRYDLILLCNIDLPWEHDIQREHPQLREYFLQWYIRELEKYEFPYRIISGIGDDRTKNAITLIDEYFKRE